MKKRKGISKRLRFEVLKRDSFTCQYCGRKAPDVTLHVDHIRPISMGGSDTILNMVTSCADCNLGKSDRNLADDTAITRVSHDAALY
jgi:5-methylcytosine-specific restriction endonuclease McrA